MVSREKTQVVTSIVSEDYDANPALCRRGLWIGSRQVFNERVVLTYDHGLEDVRVSWLLNGDQYVTAGIGADPGGPVLGKPGIGYLWPVDDLAHKLALTCTAGTPQASVLVEVLYTRPPSPYAIDPTVYHGGSMLVHIAGESVTWPRTKLLEEAECRDHLSGVVNRYVRWRRRLPGGDETDVNAWIDQVRGPAARELEAMVAQTEALDPKADAEFLDALRVELTRRVIEAHGRAGGAGTGESSLD
jgi:hypothetical protein